MANREPALIRDRRPPKEKPFLKPHQRGASKVNTFIASANLGIQELKIAELFCI
jgi:hypothetical protein